MIEIFRRITRNILRKVANDILWVEQSQNVIRLRLKLWSFVFNLRRFLAFRISTIKFQWVVENYSLPRDQIGFLKQHFNITNRFSRFLVFNSPAAVLRIASSGRVCPFRQFFLPVFPTDDPQQNSV